MKAKNGFVMRTVIDEYIIMPTDKNIDQFEGAVVLNEVSALVWEKLQSDVTREELLKAILNEFEVSKETAEKDLDMLLKRFIEYDLIEV